MKIAVVMDSFKGSISSLEAGHAVKKGILKADPDAQVEVLPIADGGEGTMEALVLAKQGRYRTLQVSGPLGETIICRYGLIDGQTAVIEMAQAAGLPLVPVSKRNPMNTTTRGVGEMIADAIKLGCRNFIIGIGGSATNDGGVGMLEALGFKFLDQQGNETPMGAKGLELLSEIQLQNQLPQLKECRFRVACDVSNTLCGENGCSVIYGPQKGADQREIAQMDQFLKQYADLAKNKIPDADETAPGSGAAGGMGFAFRTFLNATLEPGIQIVMDELNMEELFKSSDLIITGEGRLDGQSLMGKVPIGVANLAKKYHKPVVALAGSVTKEAGNSNTCGIDAFFPIVRECITLEKAMEKETAKDNLALTAEQVIRLWKSAQRDKVLS